jgi:integrase
LKWEWIDLDNRTLTIPASDTKNGHAHSLPLSDFLTELLETRKHTGSDYVFPGRRKTGHFAEPKKPILKIREQSGVNFTLHDLRRTFITIAESLNIRDYTLKRLLNHRSGGDVTDGYIMDDVDRLREPIQTISNRIIEICSPNHRGTF